MFCHEPARRYLIVALGGTFGATLPLARTDHSGQLRLDQRLLDRLRRGADPLVHLRGLHGFKHLEW